MVVRGLGCCQLATCAILTGCVWWAAKVHAQNGVKIDDLVSRTEIPLAAVSPDGRFGAYLSVRGDPRSDNYIMTVRALELRKSAVPFNVTEYRLIPSETLDEAENLLPSAGGLQWTPANVLLYLTASDGKMRLASWNPQDQKSQSLLDGHDRIAIGLNSVVTTDFVEHVPEQEVASQDKAWRVEDNYRFYRPFLNPKSGRRLRRQEWDLNVETLSVRASTKEPVEEWENLPEQWEDFPADRLATTQDTTTFKWNDTPSPDGRIMAYVEEAEFDLRELEASYAASRIVLVRGNETIASTPFERPRQRLTILGWSPDSLRVYYLNGGPKESALRTVKIDGKVTELYRESAGLQRPCRYDSQRCQSLSHDARTALLTRSTNVSPTELVKVDLTTRAVTVIDAPNDLFNESAKPKVKFYQIESPGAKTYGRLYFPIDYRVGTRYPLVITQYTSRPGFYAAVGDEVPILTLVAQGMAVFAMDSQEFNRVSNVGDFRMEIGRVRRPLEAMEWICRKLISDGIVDAERIGMTGLSYGAEIAMYAYWRSRMFRTVSVSTTSWDPNLMPFGGLGYASYMERRGFPLAYDEASVPPWRELSAGPNAHALLPPLLVQSPDGESLMSVPTWFYLRRAGVPVEFYVYPGEGHVKRSPANRKWVFERNLDWFRFWLQDYEDPKPEKTEQYQRWRELRLLRSKREVAQQVGAARPQTPVSRRYPDIE